MNSAFVFHIRFCQSLSLSLSSHCKLSNTLSKTFLAMGHLGRLLNAGLEKPKVLLL
ncbi:hypothetical protein ACSBR2_026565 [Camellia fascicularis]